MLFTDLPTEIITKILLSLDGYYIVQLAQVNTHSDKRNSKKIHTETNSLHPMSFFVSLLYFIFVAVSSAFGHRER